MPGRKRTFAETQEQEQKMTSPDPMEQDEENEDVPIAPATQQAPNFSPELLKIYYDRLFPYRPLYNWLSYFNDPERKDSRVNKKLWKHREFSFTLADDIYIRFQSFPTLEDFKKEIRKRCPHKMDIGAVYNIEPSRKHSVGGGNFTPEEKELVFDIDISDYDDVRVCCQEGAICRKCWPLMACTIKVVEAALREDFGFQNLLWVFSGRRGIHCWVGDPGARVLNSHQRTAIIEYLHVYCGSEHSSIKASINFEKLGFIPHSIRRAYEICLPYFESCAIEEQGMLDDAPRVEAFLNTIQIADLRRELENALRGTGDQSGLERWRTIHRVFDEAQAANKNSIRTQNMIEAIKFEVVFSYVYPRLDVEVSRHMNHLLKSPFVIHPKTGKVCTIIDPEQCDEFDPENQPTLAGLVDELNACPVDLNRRVGWAETSLKTAVETFRRTFLDGIEQRAAQVFRD